MTAPGRTPRPAGLLLDTHAFLWYVEGDTRRVSAQARDAIAAAPSVYVSHASAWELTVKSALGKLVLAVSFRHALAVNHFEGLAMTLDHVDRVAELPRHHGDPFDRMLVAQALHEGLTLVTHDRQLAPYGAPVLWT